ncbi:hypothetical protein [Burkholderia ambifaria]|uniref:hypothetical protein n=1 Tax=Burkholderia ambifaria TaxID=152480 RepID=UPI001FC8C5A3|nr:hypothetical protein [Burkholderia ambifaria]
MRGGIHRQREVRIGKTCLLERRTQRFRGKEVRPDGDMRLLVRGRHMQDRTVVVPDESVRTAHDIEKALRRHGEAAAHDTLHLTVDAQGNVLPRCERIQDLREARAVRHVDEAGAGAAGPLDARRLRMHGGHAGEGSDGAARERSHACRAHAALSGDAPAPDASAPDAPAPDASAPD